MGQKEAGGLELLGGRRGLAVCAEVREALAVPEVLALALHGGLVGRLLLHHALQPLVLSPQLHTGGGRGLASLPSALPSDPALDGVSLGPIVVREGLVVCVKDMIGHPGFSVFLFGKGGHILGLGS